MCDQLIDRLSKHIIGELSDCERRLIEKLSQGGKFVLYERDALIVFDSSYEEFVPMVDKPYINLRDGIVIFKNRLIGINFPIGPIVIRHLPIDTTVISCAVFYVNLVILDSNHRCTFLRPDNRKVEFEGVKVCEVNVTRDNIVLVKESSLIIARCTDELSTEVNFPETIRKVEWYNNDLIIYGDDIHYLTRDFVPANFHVAGKQLILTQGEYRIYKLPSSRLTSLDQHRSNGMILTALLFEMELILEYAANRHIELSVEEFDTVKVNSKCLLLEKRGRFYTIDPFDRRLKLWLNYVCARQVGNGMRLSYTPY